MLIIVAKPPSSPDPANGNLHGELPPRVAAPQASETSLAALESPFERSGHKLATPKGTTTQGF